MPATSTPLEAASRAARDAAENASALRAERDRMVLEALAAGHGVREVAREAGIAPIQVMRIRDRG